ncbi:MAG: type II toxin-antitoxin system VapC family toxin [Planctomycetes bacterium]|nr:type II toxin-antitoxin system VapC family toxin [Planctomycetota bacterium]
MILLDTHIWIWWVQGDPRLDRRISNLLDDSKDPIVVSSISCWEVAKLAQLKRVTLPLPPELWLKVALAFPGVNVVGLTPEIVAESANLPDGFKSDPADELIVATARVLNCPLATADRKIVGYPHVTVLK